MNRDNATRYGRPPDSSIFVSAAAAAAATAAEELVKSALQRTWQGTDTVDAARFHHRAIALPADRRVDACR